MDALQVLKSIQSQKFYSDQIVEVKELPQRPPAFAEAPGGLHPFIEEVLQQEGIERLYSHQAESIGKIREGENVVIVTGTASGKTLCYNIPVVETVLEDPLATALYLFPTKALAQDQLRGLGKFQEKKNSFVAGAYDGDTPQNLRRKLRDNANILLTNPDMLHQGILPQHARWNRFFSRLKYVVIDEIHAYRGVLGSHLTNVIRRLDRICLLNGAYPQFICCSATIGNPQEHAERITGRRMEPVTRDGSPRGPKHFLFWNPPRLESAALGQADDWKVGGDRKSSLWEAVQLMTSLMKEGVQTLAFVKTRLAAEMLFRNSRDLLSGTSPRLAESVHAYRGGYLPEERRQIEQRLASKDLLGVASTNALELGIDIGSLDACILVGYPGTVASLWQQAGRAGRGHEDALVIFVAQNAPMDQYLVHHTDYLFGQNPEQAVVDPNNPHVTVGHLKCAMQELPLSAEEATRFGSYSQALLELLAEEQVARLIEGRWYWASTEFPAASVSLRNIAGPVYTIQDESQGVRIIGTMDEISAFSQLHNHAVYLHGAETYLVDRLDLERKIARVVKRDLDYYTQSVQVSQIRIDETEEERDWRGVSLGYGDATVTTTIPMFKKVRFHSRDSLGYEKLELPPQLLETVALWLTPPPWAVERLQAQRLIVGDALLGLANVLVEIAPLFVMCDSSDIGATLDLGSLGRDTLFLFDRYPGGMGYARRCLDCVGEMLQTAYTVIRECPCEDGCPSCVGSGLPAYATTDLDSVTRGRFASKQAAIALLELLCEEGLPPSSDGASVALQIPSTEIAHVLYMDIVGFSRLSINEQTSVLKSFQRELRKTKTYRQGEAKGDMLRLPRGDGAALVFFHDPLAPLRCAIELSEGIKESPELRLRMGIHSGPVRRMEDLNSKPDVTGSGINLAQRTMDCGDAGHILLSSSFAEFLKQIEEWKDCLTDLGEIEVKHEVKLHLYNFCWGKIGNSRPPQWVEAAK